MIFFPDVDELTIVTWTPRAVTRKDRTTAGVRMDLQETDVRVKVRITSILWWAGNAK